MRLLLPGSIFTPPPPPPPPVSVTTYEQLRPIPKHAWVTKLRTLRPDSTNTIMRIQYEVDSTMPDSLDIYYKDGGYNRFRDDGHGPDSFANDFIYSAYLKDDTARFRRDLQSRLSILGSRGNYCKWTGHDGEIVTALPPNPIANYNDFHEIELDPAILEGVDCIDDPDALLKQNSLFITDLSVVEDGSRTANIVGAGTGNSNGAWSFSYLMGQAANTSVTGVSTVDFIKSWLKTWLQTPTINGQTVSSRPDVLKHLIEPWLKKVYGTGITVSTSNWESLFGDAAHAGSILKNAPFKLMAIVNRLDVRGNSGYNANLNNSGELRFIFTLIDPTDGSVPQHDNTAFSNPGFFDWEGMNVILEYGNTATTRCDIRDLGQQWADLSAYTLPDNDYNDALQAITDQVVVSGAGGSGLPNGSALLRIRTNERIFTDDSKNSSGWQRINWELRQFEIGATSHVPELVPVTNTPYDANYPYYTDFDGGTGWSTAATALAMASWAFLLPNKIHIQHGNYNIPTSYLAATAKVTEDYTQYYEFPWYEYTSGYPTSLDPSTYAIGNHPDIKLLRQQFSLNTCQGCHSGENQTEFTQVHPRGYGQSADYWSTPPDYDNRPFDNRFNNNNGETTLPNTTATVFLTGTTTGTTNYDKNGSTSHHQIVSAFLTGRRYSGTGAGTYQDDEDDGSALNPDNSTDNLLTGMFRVNDPTNLGSATLINPQQRWGYNDLARRKTDLCKLTGTCCDCNQFQVINTLQSIFFLPFPKGGH